jgi:hypothetical protein
MHAASSSVSIYPSSELSWADKLRGGRSCRLVPSQVRSLQASGVGCQPCLHETVMPVVYAEHTNSDTNIKQRESCCCFRCPV